MSINISVSPPLHDRFITNNFRVEKEKATLRSELDDIASQLEMMARGKVTSLFLCNSLIHSMSQFCNAGLRRTGLAFATKWMVYFRNLSTLREPG